jgi:hypothetical protein
MPAPDGCTALTQAGSGHGQVVAVMGEAIVGTALGTALLSS